MQFAKCTRVAYLELSSNETSEHFQQGPTDTVNGTIMADVDIKYFIQVV